MRLSELPSSPPPPNALSPQVPATDDALTPSKYQFPHPSNFVPVPYHIDTTMPHLLNHLIPLTRTPRSINISTPTSHHSSHSQPDSGSMDLDDTPAALVVQLQTAQIAVQPDGLLLYVAQATYEPGTSPLSTWVPIKSYEPDGKTVVDGVEVAVAAESPLSVFER